MGLQVYKALCVGLALGLASAAAADGDLTTPGNHDMKIKVGELNRNYWVHVPKKYDPQKPAAMLVLLPWGRGYSAFGEDFAHFEGKAEMENIILVYAHASKECGAWAAYINCDPTLEPKGSMTGKVSKWADEAAYFNAMIDEVKKKYSIDPRKVFLAGSSGGGLMAYRLSTLIAGKITAVAVMAGNFVWRNEYPQEPPQAPARPVSIIAFHGDQDRNVSYEHSANANITVWSSHESAQFWVKANRCRETPEKETLKGAGVQGATVNVERWSNDHGGPQVVLYTKVSGPHEWPSYANEFMWAFFMEEVQRRTDLEKK